VRIWNETLRESTHPRNNREGLGGVPEHAPRPTVGERHAAFGTAAELFNVEDTVLVRKLENLAEQLRIANEKNKGT
jgi:hypothetical protein